MQRNAAYFEAKNPHIGGPVILHFRAFLSAMRSQARQATSVHGPRCHHQIAPDSNSSPSGATGPLYPGFQRNCL
ncbi:hypothetical protein XELAEV_18033553mg [Xenopus laevis]|uniref:Uncharacterized protein n=1 Tax=Xenopus laevis TaxID=8355 RepID=A0A974HE48_XENLA|nr:hypothetical protein XELAEV_18033553mg [Xenopus laevis]